MGFGDDKELARESGRRGGLRLKERVESGELPGHYAEIGRRGGQTVAERKGREFFAEIGRKGGLTRAARAKAKKEAEQNGKA